MRKQLGRFLRLALLTIVAIGLLSPVEVNVRVASAPPNRACSSWDLTCKSYLASVEKIEPPLPNRAWGETGATILPLASQIMAMRNPAGVELDPQQKKYLRPLFGNLVDRVRVTYNAKLLDRWSQDGKETHIGGVDSIAQTYCHRIYLRDAPKPNDTNLLVLLAHELTHSQQCQRYGGIGKFGFQYFQGYAQGGHTYENNPLEKSARAMERKFARQLCNAIDCPPKYGHYYPNYKGFGVNLPVKLDLG